MFSNGAQIVHTIAAPGSEFQALKQISLQGVFTRIYTIDGHVAVEGKVRGLVNSFRDNTKASEIFREAKIYDIGKESKSVSPLTWEDHALANNTRKQEFLRRKIETKEKGIDKMEKEFPVLIQPLKKIVAKKKKPAKKAALAKKPAPRRRVGGRRKDAPPPIPEEKAEDPNENKEKGNDEEDKESDEPQDEEEFVTNLRYQKAVVQNEITEISREIDNLHRRAQSGEYTDLEKGMAMKKTSSTSDRTAVYSNQLKKIYLVLLQKLCSKQPEDLLDDIEKLLFESVGKEKLEPENVSTRIHLVEETHKKMKWILDVAPQPEQPDAHIHRRDSNGKKFVDLLAQSVHREDAMEITKVNRQPSETFFARVVEVLNARQNFRDKTSGSEGASRKKRKESVKEVEEDETEDNDDEEEEKKPKKKTSNTESDLLQPYQNLVLRQGLPPLPPSPPPPRQIQQALLPPPQQKDPRLLMPPNVPKVCEAMFSTSTCADYKCRLHHGVSNRDPSVRMCKHTDLPRWCPHLWSPQGCMFHHGR